MSVQTGYFLMGHQPKQHHDGETFTRKFFHAADDLKDNLIALFTDKDADWAGLENFYHDIFYPYMIGGILPGIIAGLVAYYVSVPLIRAYQARRRGALKKKLLALRAKAKAEAAKQAEVDADGNGQET